MIAHTSRGVGGLYICLYVGYELMHLVLHVGELILQDHELILKLV